MLWDAPFHRPHATSPWSPSCKFLCSLTSRAPTTLGPPANLHPARADGSQNCAATCAELERDPTPPRPSTLLNSSEIHAHTDVLPSAPKRQDPPPSSTQPATFLNTLPFPPEQLLPTPQVSLFRPFLSLSEFAFPPHEKTSTKG